MMIFLTGTPGPGWYSKVFGEISTTKHREHVIYENIKQIAGY